MTHLSGGAKSGIGFGVLLFCFVSIALGLWYRRVHLDLYSKKSNVWGGSWGVQAQRELQERINKNRDEAWAQAEAERHRDAHARAMAESHDMSSISEERADKDLEAQSGAGVVGSSAGYDLSQRHGLAHDQVTESANTPVVSKSGV